MIGYLDQPEATSEALRDGWLRTGDLAVVDADGYMTIVDRAKDLIISGGENIASVEVEHALCAHPAVSEAAVVGVPDERSEEHTSELQSLMRISYAVFCLKKKKQTDDKIDEIEHAS